MQRHDVAHAFKTSNRNYVGGSEPIFDNVLCTHINLFPNNLDVMKQVVIPKKLLHFGVKAM